MTVLVWPYRDKKTPQKQKTLLPNQEEQLMMEAWHQLRNEEEGGLLAFLLSFYYKPTEVSGHGTHAFTHLQTSQMSYSNSSPFIYHFDSHWIKFFLRHKGSETPWNAIYWFQLFNIVNKGFRRLFLILTCGDINKWIKKHLGNWKMSIPSSESFPFLFPSLRRI